LKKQLTTILKIIIFLPLVFYLGERSLIAFDEGFYVLQSRWILNSNNWIAPLFFDEVDLSRTIGIQFLMAISQKIFGSNNFNVYLPTIISSISMLFLTYELHKEILDKKFALISPLVLSTTFLWSTYINMATQDIAYATIVTFGIYKSIKAFKYRKNIDIFMSGCWVGIGAMLKTYLVAIPLIPLLPFLFRNKILFKKIYWMGIIIGFIPFLIWSINVIQMYDYHIYSDLFRKLITLSKNNTFTNPFYYYLWNIPVNIFPWTFITIIGLYFSRNNDNYPLVKYFLFTYPLSIIFLLSCFSTKTPYYPLQILSFLSINTTLGIIKIQKSSNILIKVFKRINFLLIPLLVLITTLLINTKIVLLDLDQFIINFLSLGLIIFSLSWVSIFIFKNKKINFLSILIGPYFLFFSLIHSGLLTDKSKELRIATIDLISNKNLSKEKVYTIKSDINDDNSYSMIIKILSQMPNIGDGIENIDQLKNKQYAWTTMPENILNEKNNIKIVENSTIFSPWKLILKTKK